MATIENKEVKAGERPEIILVSPQQIVLDKNGEQMSPTCAPDCVPYCKPYCNPNCRPVYPCKPKGN